MTVAIAVDVGNNTYSFGCYSEGPGTQWRCAAAEPEHSK